jgi:hypothetical protein
MATAADGYADALAMDAETSSATRARKLGFCLLFGLLSTALAEVVSTSQPAVLFFLEFKSGQALPALNPFVSVLCLLVYTLHAVFLGGLIARFGRPTWPALCFAGALFGMYEAYITKVLWWPFWTAPGDTPIWHAGDVAWHAFGMLVFWWHPVFAFILPLLLAEALLSGTRSTLAGLPRWLRRRLSDPARATRWLVIPAVIMGAFTACGELGPVATTSSILAHGGLLALLVAWWRRNHERRALPLQALLPTGAGLVLTGVLLTLFYAWAIPSMRPEALPGFTGHALILAAYLLFALLFAKALARSRPADSPAQAEAPGYEGPSWSTLARPAVLAFFAYAASAFAMELLLVGLAAIHPDLPMLVRMLGFLLASLVFGWFLGPLALLLAARATLKRRPG